MEVVHMGNAVHEGVVHGWEWGAFSSSNFTPPTWVHFVSISYSCDSPVSPDAHIYSEDNPCDMEVSLAHGVEGFPQTMDLIPRPGFGRICLRQRDLFNQDT